MKNKLPLLLIVLTSCLAEPDAVNPSELDKWTYYTVEDGIAQNFVGMVYEDPTGMIWLSHASTGGLSMYDGNTFTTFDTSDGLVSNAVNTVFYAADGSLFVGTSHGLNVRQKNSDVWLYFESFLNVPVNHITQDRNGVLWFATNGYGIVCIKDNKVFQFLDENCSDCNRVNKVLVGSDGRIWFSTYGGLTVINGNSMVNYTSNDSDLPGKALFALHEDAYGDIWIGSIDGTGIGRYHDGKFETLSLYSRKSQFVTSITSGKSRELWIGMVPDGLFHFDGVAMRKVFNGPPSDNILSVMKDHRGNVWVGTSDRGLGKYIPL